MSLRNIFTMSGGGPFPDLVEATKNAQATYDANETFLTRANQLAGVCTADIGNEATPEVT